MKFQEFIYSFFFSFVLVVLYMYAFSSRSIDSKRLRIHCERATKLITFKVAISYKYNQCTNFCFFRDNLEEILNEKMSHPWTQDETR